MSYFIIFVKEYKKQEKDTDSQNIDQASMSRNDDDEEDHWGKIMIRCLDVVIGQMISIVLQLNKYTKPNM